VSWESIFYIYIQTFYSHTNKTLKQTSSVSFVMLSNCYCFFTMTRLGAKSPLITRQLYGYHPVSIFIFTYIYRCMCVLLLPKSDMVRISCEWCSSRLNQPTFSKSACISPKKETKYFFLTCLLRHTRVSKCFTLVLLPFVWHTLICA